MFQNYLCTRNFRNMKHCFWLVLIIILSVFSSFSIEKETCYLQTEQYQHVSLNDDIFHTPTTIANFAEMPVCPTNPNLRLWKKQNLQKKCSRSGNETTLYNEKNIEKKYADKPNKKHAQILSSRYKNGFYVYFLSKLLI